MKDRIEGWMGAGVNVHILSTGGWYETSVRGLFAGQLASFNNWQLLAQAGHITGGLGKVMSKGRAIRRILPAEDRAGRTIVLLDDQFHQRYGAMINGFYSGDVRSF